jgi:hypothetical protein
MATYRSKSDEFVIDLPDGWTEQQDQGAWEFVHPSGKDQVLVTVLSAKKAISLEETKAALARALEARQKALHSLSRGLAILAPFRNQTSERAAAISLLGSDPVNSVLIYCRIIATPWRAVTAIYNGYGQGSQDIAAFTERAGPICESLRASEHPGARERHWWPWA